MVTGSDTERREAALDWLVRTNDPEFEGWDAFTAWLERDPANADAYHRLAASEAEVRPLIREIEAVSPPASSPVRRRYFIGTGVAAAAAALAILVAPRLMAVDLQTAPGQTRVVALGGEDRMVMNGGTRLELAGLDRRTVRLHQGQILLLMRDPSEEKIEVISGDLRLVDVGTVFEVSRSDGATRVIVSEGAVVADPNGAALVLDAGERLDTSDGAERLRAEPAEMSAVGAFVRGQLTYVDEPIGTVAEDLSRSTGIDFSTSRAMQTRRFTGTLSIAEVRRDPRSLEPLLGLPVEQQSEKSWRLGKGV